MRHIPFARDSALSASGLRTAGLLWLLWILWLPLFVSPSLSLIQSHPAPARLGVSFAGAAIFFALYLATSWRCALFLASPTARVLPKPVALWAPIASMLALSVFLILLNGPDTGWGDLLIYASTCAAGWLPWRSATAVIAGLVAFTLIGLGLHGGLASAITPIAFIVVPGFVVVALVRALGMSQRLRAAREEMARVAAAAEERLRIARDLHDLLGHTLSLIALKSELAGRLVNAAPARAASEIRDVETVARKALQEVRDAVAAYRQPTLASELRAAHEILAAAGIVCAESGMDSAELHAPPAIEAALSWAVREGVTNVIRHSQAHHCAIVLARLPGQIEIAISDDGHGTPPASTNAGAPVADGTARAGSGLAGLAERVAPLGGSVTAGPGPTGGFRLSVTLPLASGAPDGPVSPASAAPHAATVTHKEADKEADKEGVGQL